MPARGVRTFIQLTMGMFADLSPEQVHAAGARLAGLLRRTPLVHSRGLSEVAGGDVYLKLENEQTTGSFKLRGALNVLATLTPDQRAHGVVASSAGNHGLGVAYAARHFGVRSTIFVPSTAPQVKRDGIAQLGAAIDTSQPHYDAAMDAAKAHAARTGATFINPCLGDMLLAGQGTVALEIVDELPGLASLVVNVGGGGLLGGCASLLRAEHPSVRILGAQSVNTAAMSRSLAAGQLVEIENAPTLADGLAGQIDEEAFDIGRHALDEIVTLSEREIGEAIAWLWREHGVRAEGAGAVATGAVLLRKLRTLATPAAIVVSGGNIDAAQFDTVLAAAP